MAAIGHSAEVSITGIRDGAAGVRAWAVLGLGVGISLIIVTSAPPKAPPRFARAVDGDTAACNSEGRAVSTTEGSALTASDGAGPVRYVLSDGIAQITMDDGKANALSPSMLDGLNNALDHAMAAEAAVLLAGRPGVFSAGFDLGVLQAGGPEAADMIVAGFNLAERLLHFPRPVVIACSGHAVAMGVFLLLSGDYRVGAIGEFRFTANEVAIGLTMPRAAVEVLRQRLTPAAFSRAVGLSEVFGGEGAVAAGFLDVLVPREEVPDLAWDAVRRFAALPAEAHAASKLRARAATLRALREAIELDAAELSDRMAPG